MNSKFRISELQGKTITLGLVTVGLLLIVTGALIDKESFKLEFGLSLVKIGQFVLVTGALHRIFDLRVKTALFDEVARATIRYENVARSGNKYYDYQQNLRELILNVPMKDR